MIKFITPHNISLANNITTCDIEFMKLRDYLKKNKIKIIDFAASIGHSQSAISGYLTGARPRPRPDIALKIVEATKGKVTLNDLYCPETNGKKGRPAA